MLDPAADLVDGLGAELDDMERVEHGGRVFELVVDGVLVAVERVQGRDLDTVLETFATLVEPVTVGLPRPAGDQVEQPRSWFAGLGIRSQIDHPGQLLGATAAVFDGELADVVPHVLVHAGRLTPANRVSSSAISCNSGSIEVHTVFQVVPSCRAIPEMLACSRRIWLTAHQHARVVNNARGAATSGSCSVNTLVGHDGSSQRQVRLRHQLHGPVEARCVHQRDVTTAVTATTTPQVKQPIGSRGDSTRTVSRPTSPSYSTAITWSPARPTSRSQRPQ